MVISSDELQPNNMQYIFKKADDLKQQAEEKSSAHERSALYHRNWHTRLGVVATIISAIATTSIFASLSTQVGLEGNNVSISNLSFTYTLIFIILGFISISVPILTGLQTFLNHSQQAESHQNSAVKYKDISNCIEIFKLKYINADNSVLKSAIEELGKIYNAFNDIEKNSTILTERAKEKKG